MGVGNNKYKDFRRLNVRLIKSPVKEINLLSELFVTIEYKRENRIIIAIKFHITRNPENTLDFNELEDKKRKLLPASDSSDSKEINQELFTRLVEYFRLSKTQARQALKKYPEDYIRENLNIVEVRFEEGNINNIGAYTLKTLNDDFRPKKTKYEIDEEEERKVKERKRQDRIDRLARKFKEKNLDMIKNFMEETDRKTFDIEEDFMDFASYGKSKLMDPKDCDYFLFLYLEGVGSRFDVDCYVDANYKEYLKNYRIYQKIGEKFK